MTFAVETEDLQRVYDLVYARCTSIENSPSNLKRIPAFARKMSASIVAKAAAGSPYMIEQAKKAMDEKSVALLRYYGRCAAYDPSRFFLAEGKISSHGRTANRLVKEHLLERCAIEGNADLLRLTAHGQRKLEELNAG